MIVNDLIKVPGFDLLRSFPYTAAFFRDNHGVSLTVILANRQPLERQLGTDLIYYNEAFQAFVMVQYKAMRRELSGTTFRLPNKELIKEIARMEKILMKIQACAPNNCTQGFRFSENPFFLKLCPKIIFNPDDLSLVPGMYIPLDYWKLLETDPHIRGPKGGHRVTYDNVGRYFDNTQFVSLVANAWVGTNISQSAILESAIRATLQGRKAILFAVKKVDIAVSNVSVSDLESPLLN